MSVTRYMDNIEADLTILKMYLSEAKMPQETKEQVLRIVKRYARQEVYLAFSKQAQAIARLEQEEEESNYAQMRNL